MPVPEIKHEVNPWTDSNECFRRRRNSRAIRTRHSRFCARVSPCFGAMEDRPKCAACQKTFCSAEALRAHQEKAKHDTHDPQCGVCGRLFRSMASLREHLQGTLAKAACSAAYEKRGCSKCLRILDNPEDAVEHACFSRTGKRDDGKAWREDRDPRVVALDCEMVAVEGNEEEGACARVCMVDEDEDIVLDTYVQPEAKVLDYRENITGLRPEHLANAPSRKFVASLVQGVLGGASIRYNGRGSLDVDFRSLHHTNRKPRLLVGHDLWHDLRCLGISHPVHLQRDTAIYPPLRRANGQRQKLRELCHLHLGWRIQASDGPHCPQEDATAAMRLYWFVLSYTNDHDKATRKLITNGWRIGLRSYHCWCLDLQPGLSPSQQLPIRSSAEASMLGISLGRHRVGM